VKPLGEDPAVGQALGLEQQPPRVAEVQPLDVAGLDPGDRRHLDHPAEAEIGIERQLGEALSPRLGVEGRVDMRAQMRCRGDRRQVDRVPWARAMVRREANGVSPGQTGVSGRIVGERS